MKNIVILGSSRAGKSTLSKMILKHHPNYCIYRGDDFRYAFKETLPEVDIKIGGSGMTDKFPKFMSALFYKSASRNKEEIGYILDSCDISPEKAVEYFNDDNTILLFLGVPSLKPEEMFKIVRKYETDRDWTYDRSDEEIKEHSIHWTKISKDFQKKCEDLNIWFIDTSYDRELKLKDALEKIEEQLNEK